MRAESYLEPAEAPSPTACFKGVASPVGFIIEQIQVNRKGSMIFSKYIFSL
jgi:hypothetical protein